MKKTKFRRLAVMTASLLCCLIFTVPAYAQSNEPQPEATPAPVETEAEPETQNPFTPDGTGTVVDNATDEDGKEFYTITTADESVFYLVIDKQKTSENVYFLNAVTVDDLLPLAEQGEEPAEEVTPEPEPEPTEPVEEVTEPEPEPEAAKTDSPLLSLLLIGAVVLIGGGAGYYFTSRSTKRRTWRTTTANMRTKGRRKSQRNPRTRIPLRGTRTRKNRRPASEFYQQPL